MFVSDFVNVYIGCRRFGSSFDQSVQKYKVSMRLFTPIVRGAVLGVRTPPSHSSIVLFHSALPLAPVLSLLFFLLFPPSLPAPLLCPVQKK